MAELSQDRTETAPIPAASKDVLLAQLSENATQVNERYNRKERLGEEDEERH